MNRRPFLAFAVAETLSISGTRLSTIAIPWLVLTTTGSPVLTGVVAMAEMLPYVLAKALSGPLIDRIGPKRLAIGCDLASVLVVGLVLSVGLMGACATFIAWLLKKYHWIAYVGLAIILWVALDMIYRGSMEVVTKVDLTHVL